jgi:hypothetical protein
MKYQLTPLNFFCAFLVGLEFVFFAFADSLENEHYGYQHVFLIPIIIIGFIIDLVLQKTIKKYSWLLAIQVVLITTIILLNVKF